MKNTMTSEEIEEEYQQSGGIINRQWLSKEYVEKCIDDEIKENETHQEEINSFIRNEVDYCNKQKISHQDSPIPQMRGDINTLRGENNLLHKLKQKLEQQGE